MNVTGSYRRRMKLRNQGNLVETLGTLLDCINTINSDGEHDSYYCHSLSFPENLCPPSPHTFLFLIACQQFERFGGYRGARDGKSLDLNYHLFFGVSAAVGNVSTAARPVYLHGKIFYTNMKHSSPDIYEDHIF